MASVWISGLSCLGLSLPAPVDLAGALRPCYQEDVGSAYIALLLSW